MAACKLTNGQIVTCDTVSLPGIIATEVLVANFEDIDHEATMATATVDGEITTVVLVAGAKLIKWQSPRQTAGEIGSAAEVNALVARKYTHSATLYGYGNEGADKKRFVEFTSSTSVLFVRTTDKRIHVVGFDSGLYVTSAYNSNENEGTRVFTLATGENMREDYEHRNFIGTGSPAPTLDAAWAQLVALTV